jgi:glycine/D-amino acid oxidase-like deaminating enzyme
MGCSTALFLARRGLRVVLFDQAQQPFTGASRWNEGKIHLGYLYSAAPSLDTARLIVPGGLSFKPLVEELIGRSVDAVTAADDDIYLIHLDSVVGPDAIDTYYRSIASMVRGHPCARSYLCDATRSQVTRLTASELEAVTDPGQVAAGFRVLERSVSTTWIADAFIDAIHAEPQVSMAMGERVTGATSADGAGRGPWTVSTSHGRHGPFDHVVNALWHGRPAVDRAVADCVDRVQHHRFRVALFVRCSRPVTVPSALVAVGPYGDIKNYNGRDFYLSWYPVGMLVQGEGIEHPPEPALDGERRQAIADAVFEALAALLPGVREIRDHAERVRVEGGWVYAQGRGALDDPRSSLHRRDQLGVRWYGSYASVDTGKYSVAPYLARAIADRIACD